MCEHTYHILEAPNIYAILAAYRGIHRAEQRCGDEAELYATHIGRGYKTCNVGYDAASNAEDKGVAVGSQLYQFAIDVIERSEAFGLLSLSYKNVLVGRNKAVMRAVDIGVRDYNYSPLGQKL